MSQARRILRETRHRERDFCDMEPSAPDWQILLDLLVSEADGVCVCVSSACVAAGVPLSTAFRRIRRLESAGHIKRRCDRVDRRRIYMQLSDGTRSRLVNHLRAVARGSVR